MKKYTGGNVTRKKSLPTKQRRQTGINRQRRTTRQRRINRQRRTTRQRRINRQRRVIQPIRQRN